MPTTATATRFGDKWRLMPDRRAMSFQRRTAVGPPVTYGTSVDLTNCWHRQFSTQSNPGNPGVYILETCKIYVPRSANASLDTASERPMPGDLISDTIGAPSVSSTTITQWAHETFDDVDNQWVEEIFEQGDSPGPFIPFTNTAWIVESCVDVGALRTWELNCVAPKINNSVSISVRFQNPVETITDAGQRVVTSWTSVASFSAWVQQQDTAADDILGCRTFALQATIYSATYVDVTAQTTVLEVASGYRYTITGVRIAQSLAELNEYRLERIP